MQKHLAACHDVVFCRRRIISAPSRQRYRHENATGVGHPCRQRTTVLAVRNSGGTSMCDYSLEFVASRPAVVGDEVVSTKFSNSITGGFSAVGETKVAVCLLPGTGSAFGEEGEYEKGLGFFPPFKPGKKLTAEGAR